jgi:hypothetical protein
MDYSKIGQGRAYETPKEALDAETGTYKDPAEELEPERKLPLLPQVETETPFKLGNVG